MHNKQYSHLQYWYLQEEKEVWLLRAYNVREDGRAQIEILGGGVARGENTRKHE